MPPDRDSAPHRSGDGPEASLLEERRQKLERLRQSGVDPYPHNYREAVPISEVRADFDGIEPGEETDRARRVAGRLVARRGHGRASFLDIRDRTGRLQLHARVDLLGEELFERLELLDLGDVIGAEGNAMKTRRGELSLALSDFTVLAKALRPMPDKYHGLEDVETRYRRRELDLIANADARELFATRSRVVGAVRRFLDDRDFLEVETPVLQPLYGGALARPFTTHHNALDCDYYLRIATELYLKRLVVGGFERVYEIGKDFRNEGISYKHNPEFTMLETYEAYADYLTVASMLEELVKFCARAATGATTVCRDGQEVDLGAPWRRVTLRDAIVEHTGIDILAARDAESLRSAMRAKGLEAAADETWPGLVDKELLSKIVEPRLVSPTIVMDYPVELSPFAKQCSYDSSLVERFEAYVAGIEIANAYSELNDPDVQRERFHAQRLLMEAGDEEAAPYDEDFVRALEHGMPPTGGLGVGIDRLVALVTGRHSIREVILFPARRA